MHAHTHKYTHSERGEIERERCVLWVPRRGLYNAEWMVLFVQPTDKWRNRARGFLPTWWSPCCWYQHEEGIPVCFSHRLPSPRWAVALCGYMPYGCKVTVGVLLCLLSLLFYPEDGGVTFLWNISKLITHYKAYIPEDSTLHIDCHENLTSCMGEWCVLSETIHLKNTIYKA
jgi:hypothetical protein